MPDAQNLRYGWLKQKKGQLKFGYIQERRVMVPVKWNLVRQLAGKIMSNDYIKCELCEDSKLFRNIVWHLRIHNITCKEYKQRFPNAPLTSKIWQKNRENAWMKSLGVTNPSLNTNVKNKIGRSNEQTVMDKYGVSNISKLDTIKEKLIQTRNKTYEDTYGNKNPFGNQEFKDKRESARRKTNLKRYGFEYAGLQDPITIEESKPRRRRTNMKKYGVENWFQNPEILKKARVNAGKEPNRVEASFDRMTPKFIKYVGDGTFWIKFKDGTMKNPDFVVRPFRKWQSVIEIYGDYWHKDDVPEDLIQKYKEVGINCLVVWEREVGFEDTKRKKVESRVKEFLDIKSSETLRQTLLEKEDEDKVQTTL